VGLKRGGAIYWAKGNDWPRQFRIGSRYHSSAKAERYRDLGKCCMLRKIFNNKILSPPRFNPTIFLYFFLFGVLISKNDAKNVSFRLAEFLHAHPNFI
jgi:hypothetical protein